VRFRYISKSPRFEQAAPDAFSNLGPDDL
jgi:hypothetical protein